MSEQPENLEDIAESQDAAELRVVCNMLGALLAQAWEVIAELDPSKEHLAATADDMLTELLFRDVCTKQAIESWLEERAKRDKR